MEDLRGCHEPVQFKISYADPPIQPNRDLGVQGQRAMSQRLRVWMNYSPARRRPTVHNALCTNSSDLTKHSEDYKTPHLNNTILPFLAHSLHIIPRPNFRVPSTLTPESESFPIPPKVPSQLFTLEHHSSLKPFLQSPRKPHTPSKMPLDDANFLLCCLVNSTGGMTSVSSPIPTSTHP